MNDLRRATNSTSGSRLAPRGTPRRSNRRPVQSARHSREERWKGSGVAALTRGFVAICLLAAPTFEARLGSAALPFVCVALAATCALIAAGMRSSSRASGWTSPAADTVTLLTVVPAAALASGIEVADSRLGGGAGYFAAAAAAVIGATAIVALVAASLTYGTPTSSSIALLPAPMIVAAVIAGADRFSAESFTQGLGMAWIAAALITVLDGLTSEQVRSLLPPLGFAVFVVLVVLIGRSGSPSQVTATNSAIALVTTAIAGAALLWLPSVATDARDIRSGQ
jgi:hypothetical protein